MLYTINYIYYVITYKNIKRHRLILALKHYNLSYIVYILSSVPETGQLICLSHFVVLCISVFLYNFIPYSHYSCTYNIIKLKSGEREFLILPATRA